MTSSKPPSPRSFVHFAPDEVEQSVAARFERQVANHASAIAVRAKDGEWSYRALNSRANGIAREILRRRGEAPEGVVLLGEQSATLAAATLGVLKAGKFYVPLDGGDSPERLRYMLDDCGAALLLAEERHLPLAKCLGGGRREVLSLDPFSNESRDRTLTENPGVAISPDAYAYLFYTSGSTGRPKGVADTQRNLLHNVMRYTNSLRISPTDRLSLLQAPGFSGAVSSLFGALLNGARSCPLNLRETSTAELADYVLWEGITIYHSVPAIFRSFLEGERRFPSVRMIRLEGDQATRTDVELFRKHFGDDCLLVNGLGTTETGLVRQYFMDKTTPLPEGYVPIGYPTEDMEVLLFDAEGKPVPSGSIGEIVVRSRYLAPGYWKMADLTAKVFLPVPTGTDQRLYRTGDMGRMREDGCLEHLGRKDFRVKIRGNTVEVAEVEAALLNLSGIMQAVVAAQPDHQGEKQLVAYLVPASWPGPSVSAIRRELRRALPSYMVPAACVKMEALPLSENGKVDRKRLPAPETNPSDRDHEYVAPRDEVEAQLATLWSQTLSVEKPGVTDDFFDLGGDSLGAARLFARIEAELGRRLPLSTLIDAPTIERLAAALRRTEVPRQIVPLEPRGPWGTRPPFFAVHGHSGEVLCYRPLSQRLGREQPFYALQAPESGGESVPYTVEKMATEYLRQIRAVQSTGPYYLGGYCFGGAVAFELARQLEASGERVELVALFDADYPGAIDRAAVLRVARTHLENIQALPFPQKLVYAWGRLPGATRYLRKASLELAWQAVFRFFSLGGRPLPRWMRQTTRINRQAFRDYRPKKWAGRILHFMSAEGSSTDGSPSPDPRLGWEEAVSGRVTLLKVPGGLHTMLQEPCVADLAEKLRLCLAQADAPAGSVR